MDEVRRELQEVVQEVCDALGITDAPTLELKDTKSAWYRPRHNKITFPISWLGVGIPRCMAVICHEVLHHHFRGTSDYDHTRTFMWAVENMCHALWELEVHHQGRYMTKIVDTSNGKRIKVYDWDWDSRRSGAIMKAVADKMKGQGDE